MSSKSPVQLDNCSFNELCLQQDQFTFGNVKPDVELRDNFSPKQQRECYFLTLIALSSPKHSVCPPLTNKQLILNKTYIVVNNVLNWLKIVFSFFYVFMCKLTVVSIHVCFMPVAALVRPPLKHSDRTSEERCNVIANDFAGILLASPVYYSSVLS